MQQSSTANFKTYFITGLVILLPLALTLAIVIFIVNMLTAPFLDVVKAFFDHYSLFQEGFLFLTSNQVQKIISQIIILALLFFSTVGLGVLARWFFFHYLLRIWERIVARIPFIRSIYKTSQDVIKTLFAGSSNSFKQVVMVPFPDTETFAIGFVTRDNIPPVGRIKESLVAVYVPTTPNPTSGYLMMFKEESLIYLDMKVEDALKYVISCGVIETTLTPISKEEALALQQKKSLPE